MLNKIIQLISLGFFGVALWLITKEVEHIGFHKLLTLMLDTPLWVIGLAFIFVILDFIIISGYDFLALDYIQQKLPYKTILKTSALGFAVSNTVGHSFASGGAVRYMFYTPLGVSRANVLILIAFETLTLFMGMGLIYVIATLLTPFAPHITDHSHLETFYIASACVVIAFLIYYFLVVRPQKDIKIGGIVLKAPTKKMTIAQLLVGFADNFMVSIVFYCILRYYIDTPFLPVFIIFNIAQITGQVSQVPGGLGILTSLFVLLFPHTMAQKAGILASLFIFRVVYFFVPLFIACLYLIWYEITKK